MIIMIWWCSLCVENHHHGFTGCCTQLKKNIASSLSAKQQQKHVKCEATSCHPRWRCDPPSFSLLCPSGRHHRRRRRQRRRLDACDDDERRDVRACARHSTELSRQRFVGHLFCSCVCVRISSLLFAYKISSYMSACSSTYTHACVARHDLSSLYFLSCCCCCYCAHNHSRNGRRRLSFITHATRRRRRRRQQRRRRRRRWWWRWWKRRAQHTRILFYSSTDDDALQAECFFVCGEVLFHISFIILLNSFITFDVYNKKYRVSNNISMITPCKFNVLWFRSFTCVCVCVDNFNSEPSCFLAGRTNSTQRGDHHGAACLYF